MRPNKLRRTLALAGCGAIIAGATLGTDIAKADAVDDYVAIYGPNVCEVLAEYPSVAGLEGVALYLMGDGGFSARESGEIAARSIIGYCPEYTPIMQGFINKWSTAGWRV